MLTFDRLEAARLRHIVDALPAYVAYVDTDLRYLMVNRTYEAWFDMPASEIVGRKVSEVLGSSYSKVELHLRAALRGEPQQFEAALQTAGGERYLGVTHLPDRDQEGRVLGVIVQGHDITQRKVQEQALLRSEKLAAAGRLASSISHELNNPLESLVNLLYLIEKSAQGETQELARVAQEQLARISQVTTQTLRFFKQSSRATPADPEDIVSSVLMLYRGRLANSGIEARYECRGRARGMWFESEVRQVLSHLVSNALDAMRGKGGVLTIRSKVLRTRAPENGQTVRITVCDSGPGIEPSARPRIFEPFFTTKGMTATGLGLWVSRELIKKHHGEIRVRSSSTARYHGTMISVDLPLAMD